MYKIIFLSYIRNLTGQKSIEIPVGITTVGEAMDYLNRSFPDTDFDDTVIIMGEKALLIPNDYTLTISGDIMISPIITGGLF